MLLINPPAKTNKEIPNIALAYIGTISNSKIVDLNTLSEPAERFLDNQTEALGISVQQRTYEQYKKITNLYKKRYPDSKVISISGIIDVECCHSFLRLEENLNFPQQFDDNLPFPNYELFDSFNTFKKHWRLGSWSYAILTSLGCPHQCIYCAAKNRKWQARSIENCYEELKQAKNKYNIKSFQILDDYFNFQPKRVIKFCEIIKPLRLTWYCSNGLRADKFDEKMAKAMSESGCKRVSFGIESIDQDVLNFINKGLFVPQIEQAINIAKKYFRGVSGFFIIGLPGSSYRKDLNSLHWALRRGINAHFSYFSDTGVDFYGENSTPTSNQYPISLQKRLADLTEFMRVSSQKKFINSSIMALKYDFLYFPFYLKIGLQRIINKINHKYISKNYQ